MSPLDLRPFHYETILPQTSIPQPGTAHCLLPTHTTTATPGGCSFCEPSTFQQAQISIPHQTAAASMYFCITPPHKMSCSPCSPYDIRQFVLALPLPPPPSPPWPWFTKLSLMLLPMQCVGMHLPFYPLLSAHPGAMPLMLRSLMSP